MLIMVDKQANIDLVFRNGLKDYEVLPPHEVWNNIRPAIKNRQRPLFIMRVAAMIAVLTALGFLVFRFSREMPVNFESDFLAFGQESAMPENTINNERLIPEYSPADAGRNVSGNELPADRSGVSVLSDEAIIPAPADSNTGSPALPEDNNGFENPGPLAFLLKDDSGISQQLNYDYDSQLLNEETPAIDKISRWSINAMASPTYQSTFTRGTSDLAKQIMSSEQTNISYTGGLSFSYKINEKLSIQSGLYYSSVGQEVDGISTFGGFRDYIYTKGDHNFEVLTSSGTIYTNNADVFLFDGVGGRVQTRYTSDVFDPTKASLQYMNNSLHQSFSYLEMPFFLRYKLLDGTVDFNLIGGLSYNMLVNNSVYAVIEGGRYQVGKTEGVSPFMFSSSFGMGMEYTLTENISLNLEPTFRYYLNPFSNMTGIREHPYSIGVFSGLSYKF